MWVDVIIATNRPVLNLIPVLESYKEQSYKDFSIIIVTEGEKKSLIDICSELEIKNVHIYSIPKGTSNAGVSRNNGIGYASGNIILFSDDDMVVSPDFIEEHVKSHEKQKNAIVRGLRYQKRVDGSFYVTRWEKEAIKYWTSEKKHIAWAYFVTSNVSISRNLLNKVGGFDSNFKWSGCEDTDIAYRLIEAGGELIANENAINYHLGIDDVQVKFEKRRDNFKYFQSKFPDNPFVKLFVRLTLRAVEQDKIIQIFTEE